MTETVFNPNTKFLSLVQRLNDRNNNVLAYKTDNLLIVEKMELSIVSIKLLMELFCELFNYIEDVGVIRLCDKGLHILKLVIKRQRTFHIEKINTIVTKTKLTNQVFIKRSLK